MDPYAVLGVDPNASSLTIARAHRRLAKRYHPDLHPGAEAADRMRRINEAWHILSNPSRRARHDAVRSSAGHAPRYGWMPADTAPWARGRPYASAGPRVSRRPPRPEPAEAAFGDQRWVAAVVSAGLAFLVFLGTYLGSTAP
jgi:curved DNA-binding protein CbpA